MDHHRTSTSSLRCTVDTHLCIRTHTGWRPDTTSSSTLACHRPSSSPRTVVGQEAFQATELVNCRCSNHLMVLVSYLVVSHSKFQLVKSEAPLLMALLDQLGLASICIEIKTSSNMVEHLPMKIKIEVR